VIKAFDGTLTDKIGEILVTLVILRKQDEMIIGLPAWDSLFVFVVLRGNVDFAADDRSKALFDSSLVELKGCEKVPVVGDSDCFHSEFGDLL